jgi:hypothetical protein
MRVEVIRLPESVGLGSPPRRIAEVLHVYPNGMAVARGGPRAIVFDGEPYAIRALRYIGTGDAIGEAMYRVFPRGKKDVSEIPCAQCRDLHPENTLRACERLR